MTIRTRALAALAMAVLAGCGTKANTLNIDGRGYAKSLGAHNGPVCLLKGVLPAQFEHQVVGTLKGNRQVPGNFEGVRVAMANEARNKGADVVENLVMEQDWAFRGIFLLRPIGQGQALRLRDPGALDCLALGGLKYGTGQRQADPQPTSVQAPLAAPVPAAEKASTPLRSESTAGGSYDDCIRRVMRISDPQLRLKGMEACDTLN
ncbi:MAG: hypothetical protein ABWY06_06055 [Pseudomonas sp.]|uniref:hypothetical protein n=1 Tax=Pseudomonas sp. TaxID=306 RepID=UPI0033916C35